MCVADEFLLVVVEAPPATRSASPRRLSKQQKGILVNAFFLVPCMKDEPIIKEGEDGDHFYMVDAGRCPKHHTLSLPPPAIILSCA